MRIESIYSFLKLKQGLEKHSFDIILLITLIVVSGGISIVLGQDANWDLKNYHLYNAFSFIENRLLYDYGTAIQWYLNPIIDIPYYLLVKYFYDYPKIIAFFQGSYVGFLAFVLNKIFTLFFQLKNKKDFLLLNLSVLGAFTGAILISEWGTTFNDIQITLLVCLSLYIIIKGLSDDYISNKSIFISFFLLGIAVGLKLTSAIYLIGAFVSLLCIINCRKKIIIYSIIGSILGGIFSGGYWSYKMIASFESPIFPFYNHIFKSDWFLKVSGSDRRWFPGNIDEWLLYPKYWIVENYNIVTEVEFSDSRLFFGLIFSIIILLVIRNKNIIKFKFLIIFYVVTYIVWLFLFSYYRYAMVLEVISVFIVIYSLKLLLKPAYSFTVSVIFFILIVSMTSPANWGRVKYGQHYIDYSVPNIEKNSILTTKEGDPPRSYLFFLFSKTNRNILFGPSMEADTKLSLAVKNIFENHEGKIYFIAQTTAYEAELNEVEFKYKLKPKNNICKPIYTSLDKNKYVLCEVGYLGSNSKVSLKNSERENSHESK